MTLLRPVDHTGALSVRWDDAEAVAGPDVIALSVADMDFASPREVVEAVVERARRGAFGYTQLPPDYRGVIADWFSRRHGWQIDPEWIVPVGRVVEVVPVLLRELTDDEGGVVVPTPAYGPVTSRVEASGRQLRRAPLIERDGSWTFDFPALADALVGAQLLILTGPHNPTGRVWSAAELATVADLAAAARVLVIADEVHADLVLPGHRHQPFAGVCPDAVSRTMTFVSPGKTFNMAGLESSHLVVADPVLRAKVVDSLDRAGFHNPRYFAAAATVAGYTHGEPWLDELLELLASHLGLLRDRLATDVPGVRLIEPEGTHLAWLDCRGWTADEDVLMAAIRSAGLVLTPGSDFGPDLAGYARINLAVPTAILRVALDRLARARAGFPHPQKERDDA